MPLSQRVYWRLRPWITPGLENSHITYARALGALVQRSESWLDLGCGHDFVPDWAPFHLEPARRPARIVGIDPDVSALMSHRGLTHRVIGSGERLPFAHCAFDLVTANMVLEHVETPSAVFEEVFRVLKPGGMFLGHTPNAAGYTTRLTRLGPHRLRVWLADVLQGRRADDVYPTYYRANTAQALTSLAGHSGFTDWTVEYVDSSPLFANLPPLLVPEMCFIRLMQAAGTRRWRPCLLLTLRKPETRSNRSEGGG